MVTVLLVLTLLAAVLAAALAFAALRRGGDADPELLARLPRLELEVGRAPG